MKRNDSSKKSIARKKPICDQKLAIVATEFYTERRESYYKVRFRDLEGRSRP